MSDQLSIEFNAGLSEEEKNDLEQMIQEFQNSRTTAEPGDDIATLQQQLNTMNKHLAHLTNMILTFDQRIKPLNETIRLTFQKSEILNQRINMLIDSIRTGDLL